MKQQEKKRTVRLNPAVEEALERLINKTGIPANSIIKIAILFLDGNLNKR